MTRPGTRASVAAEARRVKRELARLGRPAGAFDASRYFRGEVDLGFYNVGTAGVRNMARELHRRHRDDWSMDEAALFADRLVRDRYLEVKSVGIEVLARYRRDFAPRLLAVWKRWLARNDSANWATTDAICGLLIGPLLVMHPSLVRGVASWSRHPNMWVRRASAVSLIPSMRSGRALDSAYGVARALHADREDLIQKAVGWMLREAGKADAARLEAYLRRHGRTTPRTTVRYAIERMSPAKRKAMLLATRA